MESLKVAAFFILFGSCLSNPTTIKQKVVEKNASKIDQNTEPTAVLQNPRTDVNESNSSNGTTTPSAAENEIEDDGWEFENTTIVDTRRILYSKQVVAGKRPYMVYLSLTKESAKAHKYRGWLCGGVIVHPSYVLTSAACVEDADRFYIVSGTLKFVDSFDYKDDDCVCKHRRKVVWKCIPKNYKFDFQDSIKWSSNDIAIVKVDKPFKIGVKEKGCQFAACAISYNNISRELEKPGTKAFIAGWGSGSNFREGVYRRQDSASPSRKPENAKCLQEAKVCIMDNESCAKKWAQRFRNIITQYMICTKDVMRRLSEICDKKYANCTDVETRRQIDYEIPDDTSSNANIDLGRHLIDPDDYTARRSSMQGGFCENDHGGPLVVKYQGKERVIGVISACKIDPKTHSCHGPFLYTSVFKNRQFISCAINKDIEGDKEDNNSCRRVFRTGITHEEFTVDWNDYEESDGDTRANADSDDDSGSDDSDDKATLRIKNKDKKKPETDAKNDSNSSSNSEESKADKKGEVKAETKKEKKSKSKSKKDKKKDKIVSEDDDSHIKTGKKEVFYESSKEENVNEPEE